MFVGGLIGFVLDNTIPGKQLFYNATYYVVFQHIFKSDFGNILRACILSSENS